MKTIDVDRSFGSILKGMSAQTDVVSRRKQFSIGIAVILLAILIVVFAFSNAEPVYKGRPLSSWCEQWTFASIRSEAETDLSTKTKDNAAREASDAITKIGTNGLPVLFDKIKHDGSWAKGPWISPLYKVPFLKTRLEAYVGTRQFAQQCAVNAFETLNTNASPAIPGLMKLVSSKCNPNTRNQAIWCLVLIGEPSVPALRQLLQSPDPDVSSSAASRLADWQGNRSARFAALIPDLALASQSTNKVVARRSADALNCIKWATGQLPLSSLTIAALNSPNPHFRAIAVFGLAHSPETIIAGRSAVRAMLNDPDEEVRKAATNELQGLGQK